MNKKFGFTLAEVLITLGIIGVVAAMTIPTLIANTNSAKFRSQFKKTISTLNQAGLMAQAQFDIDYSTNDNANTVCDENASPNATTPNYSLCGIFNGTLAGHTIMEPTAIGTYLVTPANGTGETAATASASGKPTGTLTADGSSNNYTKYLKLADGSMVAFSSSAHGCSKQIGEILDTTWTGAHPTCVGFIDVNGVTLPNKEVKCGGTTATEVTNGTCEVPNDANHMTDIYPVAFHDATVEPLTNAARYVLTTSK